MPQPSEELVDLIDSEDNVIGQARRGEIRSRNLLHRGVGIICRNPAGEIFVHRRTSIKDVFPGLYDMFVGGVVGTGESYATAARREIEEELGVVGPIPKFLFRHLYVGKHNHAWVSIFEVVWDGPIRLQASVVEWGTYLTNEQLEDKLAEWDFVPDGLEIWQRYLSGSFETGAEAT